MDKLLKKLHRNKVTMNVCTEDVFFNDRIHVRFTKGNMNRRVELNMADILSCEVGVEFILLQELREFLSDFNLGDEDDETEK